MSSQVRTLILISVVGGMLGCGGGMPPLSGNSLGSSAEALSNPPGALVRMDLDGTVGVLLDEIPAGTTRDWAAVEAIFQGNDAWVKRAADQVQYTNYLLVFRQFYYTTPKGALPLPDPSVRKFEITGFPTRTTIQGHDMVTVPYHFHTYLVTDPASPAASEPALSTIGGTWDEPFMLPIDPELLLERTGYSCMDEFGFPPNSVFEENTSYFYDQTCVFNAPGTFGCHITRFPKDSCPTALKRHVGMTSPNLHFTRVAYDSELASDYRVGTIVNPTGTDLGVVTQAMSDENRVYYRYFAPDACEVQEKTIGAPGWRRLVTFSANIRNDGTNQIHLGDPTDSTNPWVAANDFVFSNCHQHYHFNYYGNFAYGNTPGLKRAFCLEDTNRYHNDETTGLTGVHQTCNFQGIEQGWGDEYQFGISGQWVDVTGVNMSTPQALTFNVNPSQMLCEGQTLNASNQPVDPTDFSQLVFDPTNIMNENGQTVGRVRCNFFQNYSADNLGSIQLAHGPGSFVNDACTRGQIGPKRECGFSTHTQLHSCTPGAAVKLNCTSDGSPQVLRICDRSDALGGIACTYPNSFATKIVDGDAEAVTFICPPVLDSTTGEGGYSIWQGALLPGSGNEEINCTGG